jgi:cytochrome c553
MNKISLPILAFGCLVLAAGAALADGKIGAGKAKSEDCADCHGPDGTGDGDTIPSIAGMPAEKFTQAIADFRSGKRSGSKMMTKMGQRLSVEDVADLAAYYASLKP